MPASDMEQRQPGLGLIAHGVQQGWAFLPQCCAVQAFDPIEPVKKARLRLAIKRASRSRLRGQEIIVIFTLNWQLPTPINPARPDI